MGLSDHWDNYLGIIALQTVKKLPGINPMVLSTPRSNYLDIIALDPVNNNFEGLTGWALLPLGPTILMLLPCIR